MKKDEIKEIKEVDESVAPSSLDIEGGSLEDGSAGGNDSSEDKTNRPNLGIGTNGPEREDEISNGNSGN